VAHPAWTFFGFTPDPKLVHPTFALTYVVISLVLLLMKPGRLSGLWQGAKPDTFCSLPGVEDEDDVVLSKA
jgi:hypothetical protein